MIHIYFPIFALFFIYKYLLKRIDILLGKMFITHLNIGLQKGVLFLNIKNQIYLINNILKSQKLKKK